MKKTLCILLSVLMIIALFSLIGCQSAPEEKKDEDTVKAYDLPERLQETKSEESQGHPENETKPLVICVDIQSYNLEAEIMDLIVPLQTSGKLGEVQVEYLSVEGGTRASAINRIRTEIMSGAGPDLFIIKNTNYFGKEEPIFPMPEKVMEAGLLLPLDPYIQNNTEYAEWDKLTQSVMEAGKNEEGQQIIPLAYTMPALFYRAEDVQFNPIENMTWREMVEDENLHNAAMLLGAGPKDYLYSEFEGYYNHRLQYILGDLADYANEELLFTEEELLAYVEETVAISEEVWQEKLYDQPNWYQGNLGVYMNKLPMFMDENGSLYDTMNGVSAGDTMVYIPISSDDGGYTAAIMTYAAVNRNTELGLEAFRVIDRLLSTHMMCQSPLYSNCLYDLSGYGIPMHEDVLSEAYPIRNNNWYLSEANFAAFDAVRDQITAAQFTDTLFYAFDGMMVDVSDAVNHGEEDLAPLVSEWYSKMRRQISE